MRYFACIALALPLCFLCLTANAEKADRDRPIHIEADRMSFDDLNNVQVYEGSVMMTQGTTQLRASRLVVTQDADGFQKGVATGGENGLAHYKEKLEGKDAYVEGKGERIEYDAKKDQAEFFVRAWVKNDEDEIRGDYIRYNALNESFLAEIVPSGNAAENPPPRVRALIMPKKPPDAGNNEIPASAASQDEPALKASESLGGAKPPP